MEGSTTMPQGSRPEVGPKRETVRYCTQCQETKSLDDFDRCNHRKLIRMQCKTCVRTRRHWWLLAKRYGVSKDQFMRLLQEQNGVCAICKCEMASARFKRPSVDHCHKTGRVRGLLCSCCNTGLGLFKDSPERFRSAIAYIDRHNQTGEIVSSSE